MLPLFSWAAGNKHQASLSCKKGSIFGNCSSTSRYYSLVGFEDVSIRQQAFFLWLQGEPKQMLVLLLEPETLGSSFLSSLMYPCTLLSPTLAPWLSHHHLYLDNWIRFQPGPLSLLPLPLPFSVKPQSGLYQMQVRSRPCSAPDLQ